MTLPRYCAMDNGVYDSVMSASRAGCNAPSLCRQPVLTVMGRTYTTALTGGDMTDRDLLRQLDLACINRDLQAAKRVSRKLVLAFDQETGRTSELHKFGVVLRTYAASIHGWEIP